MQPKPGQAITSELGGVPREPQVEMATIVQWVINTVGNDDACGQGWEIMVKCLKWSCAAHSALTIKLS